MGSTQYTSESKDLGNQFNETGIKYGISVGRRQPLHVAHLDCIKEIVASGLIPIIVIGSDNAPDNPHYDPVNNPMNYMQQLEQIRLAMKDITSDYVVISIKDFGNSEKWTAELAEILHRNGIDPNETVMHFREKEADIKTVNSDIKPLSQYQQDLSSKGISIWKSFNLDKSLDLVSSSNIRMIDIDSLKINKSVITPDYIFELATKARNDNADRSLLNNVPISMIDISLARINAEKGITTSEILKDKSPGTVLDLVEMIYNSNACQKPGAETSGQINVRENDITKRVING